MPVICLAVGKKHEDWVKSGIETYEKRLKQPYQLEWALLPHSGHDGEKARAEESEAILRRLQPADVIILLDERGTNLSSPEISQSITEHLDHSRRVVFIVGGAYGVTDELRRRAHIVWSLSKLVFPHQLVRLILTEQLYRAQEIANGGKYHHD